MNSKQKGKIHRIEQICCSETSCPRLHWDFRLEPGGVLKSRAIPKEPGKIPDKKYLTNSCV